MTLSEAKSSIAAQLNQQAVATLVDQLAQLAVKQEAQDALAKEHDELKAKYAALLASNAALEARVTEIVKSRDGPLPV